MNPFKTQIKKTIQLLLLFAISENSIAQEPTVLWQKCIGGSKGEVIFNLIKLHDGNYLHCGQTNSPNGDFNSPHGNYDAFLVKTDVTGNIIWEKSYGGSRNEAFYNLVEANNGDIIAIGTTSSNNQQVSGNHGSPGTADVWLVRTRNDGILINQRCFGGSGSEGTPALGESQGLMIDTHGNILFTSQTNSVDGDVTGNHGDYDGWLVKVNFNTFNIIKSTTIGTAYYDAAYTIHEIDGNLLITGSNSTVAYTTTNSDSVENNGGGFATKIDSETLNTIWYRSYGGSASEYCNASVVSRDGNLVLAGHAESTNGDCIGNNGEFNTWTWKIDISDGSIIWKNFTGVSGAASAAFNLIATQDGGFAAIGTVVENSNPDAFVVKVNENGLTEWTKHFGGSSSDRILCGVEAENGTILTAGWTSSNDGVVSGNHGGTADAWVVDLGLNGNRISFLSNANPVNELKVIPNPISNSTSITFSLLQSEHVSVKIVDGNGRLVSTLVNELLEKGKSELVWNAEEVNSGIYFLQFQSVEYSQTEKIVVAK